MLAYINSFLLGGDILAIQVGTSSIRVVALTLLIGIISYIIKHKSLYLSKDQIIIYFLFISAITFSIPQSLNPTRSVSYLLWMIFLFLIQTIYYNLEYKNLGEKGFERMLIKLYRFCSATLLIEFILRIVFFDESRPRLFFYEPAHTAIFMIPYLVIAIINASTRKTSKDIFFSLGALLILFSATAFFSIIATFLIIAIFVRKTRKTIITISIVFLIVIFAMMARFELNEKINLMIGFLASAEDITNALELIFHRSGTRVIRLYYGIEAFKSAPWFGIGAGAANTYTLINDIPADAITYLDPAWDDVAANPFVNPFVEIAATMGVLGIIAFTTLIVRLTFIANTSGFRQKMAIAAIAMFAGILLESTFLRHYIWFAASLALIPSNQTISLRKIK